MRLCSCRATCLGLVALIACTPDKGTSTTEGPEATSDASTAGTSTSTAGTSTSTGAPTTGDSTTTTTTLGTTTTGESTSTGTTQGIETSTTQDVETSTTGGDSTTTAADGTSSGDATTADTTAADTGAPDVVCEGTGMSSLPGVTIVFPPQKCKFTLAEADAGIEFAYEVHVDAPVADVQVYRQDPGKCGEPGPSGLVIEPTISGNGQKYCHCNQGLCPGLDLPPVTLEPGVYPSVLEWSGINWGGPHVDPGPSFPAGKYVVQERALGHVTVEGVDTEFEIVGTLPIALVH